MRRAKKSYLILIAFLVLFSIGPKAAEANVLAFSDMALFDLRYELSDPDATLIWTDDWFASVEANAQDTLSDSVSDIAELLGNDGEITAIAAPDLVFSLADYVVADGLNIGSDPDALVDAFTFSVVEIVAPGLQGDADARTDFDNFFVIQGGGPDETLTVTFHLEYSGALEWEADEFGSFSTALLGLLELWPVDLDDPLSADLISESFSGSNSTDLILYDGTLTVSSLLNYETEYWLYAEAGSEVSGANAVPEPGTLVLLTTGAAALLGLRRYYRAD